MSASAPVTSVTPTTTIDRESPESRVAESLSLLALRLHGDLAGTDGGRVVGVVAADDDAKGVETLLELAWCLAEELGHTVLLVDGAFGDGQLGAALGLDGRPGLAECLDSDGVPASAQPNAGNGSGHAHPDAAGWTTLAQPTRHPRIRVLPQGRSGSGGGNGGKNSGGALTVHTQAARDLFAQARARHDFVLLRSSIVADVSRSLALCSLCDAALLLAVEEQTTWDQIARGQRLLNDCGARRVALVLASASPQPRAHGH